MTVVLDIWTVRPAAVPRALWRMARDPRQLRQVPHLDFHKSLGTGAGRRFTARDADLRQWALLTCWSGPDAGLSATRQRWGAIAERHTRFTLATIASHGQWSGVEPFSPDPAGAKHAGPIAAITRARVRTPQWRSFQRAVPPVAAVLQDQEGLLYRIGIGEAPIGLQGTFSVWQDPAALRSFAYQRPEHVAVIEQTRDTGWYSEELFARFAVLDVSGDAPW
ncbi:MAG: monooxygenase [Actinobacteria bacterium]|nr:monooxygenase [Actinomycetota bacterium]MCB8995772.1 monooxygenase [Actinomycetota bacterium]MCB9414733.1 monooxygenase [Actinomycetota bacterium]MCB9424380.1 monooxygenase [Actinomycetota bacterium]